VFGVDLDEPGSAECALSYQTRVHQSIDFPHCGWGRDSGESGKFRDAKAVLWIHEKLRQNEPLGVGSKQGRELRWGYFHYLKYNFRFMKDRITSFLGPLVTVEITNQKEPNEQASSANRRRTISSNR
jgi:hypothetical protein